MNYDFKNSKAQPESGHKGDYSKNSKAQPESGHKGYDYYGSKSHPDSSQKGDYSGGSKEKTSSSESNLKILHNHEIRCVYKIDKTKYYRNVHIYNYKKRIVI